jgi:DNA invertase Pin-like site-specific DNA recombinase
MAGRPVIVFLNHHEIVELRAQHLPWKTIANRLNISPRTLKRWRQVNFAVDQVVDFSIMYFACGSSWSLVEKISSYQ